MIKHVQVFTLKCFVIIYFHFLTPYLLLNFTLPYLTLPSFSSMILLYLSHLILCWSHYFALIVLDFVLTWNNLYLFFLSRRLPCIWLEGCVWHCSAMATIERADGCRLLAWQVGKGGRKRDSRIDIFIDKRIWQWA